MERGRRVPATRRRVVTLQPPIVPPVPFLREYWRASRAHRYSLLFALPLLVAYQALVVLAPGPGEGLRNGADAILTGLVMALAGPRGGAVLAGVLALVAVALAIRDRRATGAPLQGRVFALMAVEAAVLALVLGVIVGTITAALLGRLAVLVPAVPAVATLQPVPTEQLPWATRLMVSLGAGLYEELLFRVLLVGVLRTVARVLFGMSERGAAVLAIVGSALLFSLFHYVGAFGDPFTLSSFVFRAVAGIVFSALYVVRGFGITAWTHALYDVYLLAL